MVDLLAPVLVSLAYLGAATALFLGVLACLDPMIHSTSTKVRKDAKKRKEQMASAGRTPSVVSVESAPGDKNLTKQEIAATCLQTVGDSDEVNIPKLRSQMSNKIEAQFVKKRSQMDILGKDDQPSGLVLPTEERSIITFQDVHYTVNRFDWSKLRRKKIPILRGASGYVPAAKLTALLGASGGGKTTLLNVLSHRTKGGVISGEINLNGTPLNVDAVRQTGFAHQFDILFAHMTVRQYLEYVAMLKLPPIMTRRGKFERVQQVLETLRISHIAENIIGDEHRPGISGGQAKRVTIAAELLTDPSILFLDEPTSGLDALSSLHLMRCLQDMATAGRTILCTIHQPRAEVFDCFDHMVLLKAGQTIFCGSPVDAASFLSTISVRHASMYSNKADFITDVICADPKDTREGVLSGENILSRYDESFYGRYTRALLNATVAHRHCMQPAPSVIITGNPFHVQVAVHVSRIISCLKGDIKGYIARVVQAIAIATILGTVFWQTTRSFSGTNDRLGSIYFVVQIVLIIPLITNNRFYECMRVFQREYESKRLSSSAFLTALWSTTVVLDSIDCAFTGLITYWLIGYFDGTDNSAEQFFSWILILTIGTAAVASVMVLFMSFFNNETISRLLAMAVLNLGHMLSGFFVHKDNVPIVYKPFYFFSMTKWTVEGCYDTLIRPLTLHWMSSSTTCEQMEAAIGTPVQRQPCPVGGVNVLEGKGMEHADLATSLWVLICYCIVFRILALIVFQFKTMRNKRKVISSELPEEARSLLLMGIDALFGWAPYFSILSKEETFKRNIGETVTRPAGRLGLKKPKPLPDGVAEQYDWVAIASKSHLSDMVIRVREMGQKLAAAPATGPRASFLRRPSMGIPPTARKSIGILQPGTASPMDALARAAAPSRNRAGDDAEGSELQPMDGHARKSISEMRKSLNQAHVQSEARRQSEEVAGRTLDQIKKRISRLELQPGMLFTTRPFVQGLALVQAYRRDVVKFPGVWSDMSFYIRTVMYSVPVWTASQLAQVDDHYHKVQQRNYRLMEALTMAMDGSPFLRWKRWSYQLIVNKHYNINIAAAACRRMKQMYEEEGMRLEDLLKEDDDWDEPSAKDIAVAKHLESSDVMKSKVGTLEMDGSRVVVRRASNAEGHSGSHTREHRATSHLHTGFYAGKRKDSTIAFEPITEEVGSYASTARLDQ